MFESIWCADQVPTAFYHGDFVSWNLINQRNGRWCAIDWEFGDCDGVPLLDLFHFLLRLKGLCEMRRVDAVSTRDIPGSDQNNFPWSDVSFY